MTVESVPSMTGLSRLKHSSAARSGISSESKASRPQLRIQSKLPLDFLAP